MKLVIDTIEKEVDISNGPGHNVSFADALDRLIKAAKEFEDEGIDPGTVQIHLGHRTIEAYLTIKRLETPDEMERRLQTEKILRNKRYQEYLQLKEEFESEE